jgi:UDP-GlcNAc:undecaprenyl-phosphate GlcNAc-1-phosphate transferase
MVWENFLPLGLAIAFNIVFTPVIRRLSFRLGTVALPREDRWHKKPTPTLGGVGIFISFSLALVISYFVIGANQTWQWSFLTGSVLLFILGLYDEFRPLSPIAKFVGQILAATLVIALGYTSTFFSPRISNAILAQIPNILFTYVWLVGITNAINLLDNMDGLAGGISLITALILGYFFWNSGNITLLWISLALGGSILGFLIYNFPPAKIFMGDSGSLFIGFSLAGLAIAQQQQASNVFAVIGVPTLIFLLPILDTSLVMITRLMRGQSPIQGGRDHTSHRLIAFGLSERQALLVLYGIALFSAIMAAFLEALNYWLSLVLAPILIISLALLAAYLGRLKVVSAPISSRQGRSIARFMMDLTYRRRLLEVILDFFLIGIAFYLAFLVGYSLRMSQARLEIYLNSLPIALAGAYISIYLFGVYRSVWRFIGFDDVFRFLGASIGGVVLMAALIFGLASLHLAPWAEAFPHIILIYFGVFLFLGLAFSRSSFRLLDTLVQQRTQPDEHPILIAGAGDMGEMVLHWIQLNPQLKFRPIGFIDPDPLISGRYIHGIKVFGGMDLLSSIIEHNHIAGVILAESEGMNDWTDDLIKISLSKNCWIRKLKLELENIS